MRKVQRRKEMPLRMACYHYLQWISISELVDNRTLDCQNDKTLIVLIEQMWLDLVKAHIANLADTV